MDVCTFGNPVLRAPCTPVGLITNDLKQLALDMLRTMYETHGVGLAAPQVGRTETLCVIDVPQDAEKSEEDAQRNADIPMPLVMFNPEILATDGVQRDEEGCLSFPGIHAPVTRANKVTFTFIDTDGQRKTYTAYALLARAVQHELDHLAGKLFVDHVGDAMTIPMAMRLKKLEEKTLRKLGK